MKSLLPLVLFATILTTRPAHARHLLDRCAIWLGLVPKTAVTTPPKLPNWDPQRLAPPRGDLPPGEKPALPQSDFFEVVALVPDPLAPGRFLYRVRRRPGADPSRAGIEGSDTFEELVRQYPSFAERYGIRLIAIDGVEYLEYPMMEGINARLAKDPTAMKFWRDTGSEDTDHMQIARALVARNEMVLSLKAPVTPDANEGNVKRSYHFHDMFVHVLGFEAIPATYTAKTRERLAWYLRMYDDPAFANASLLKEHLASRIRQEVSELDGASAGVQRQLAKLPAPPKPPDTFNLFLAISRLGSGNAEPRDTLRREKARFALTAAQKAQLDAHLAEVIAPVEGDKQAHAKQLGEKFQALMSPSK